MFAAAASTGNTAVSISLSLDTHWVRDTTQAAVSSRRSLIRALLGVCLMREGSVILREIVPEFVDPV